MGSGPSSYKNNNELSFLVHKKITTLKPTYLIYQPNHYDKNKLCLSFEEPSDTKIEIIYPKPLNNIPDIKIKINCQTSFYIDDIIGYWGFDEGYRYYYHLTFLHDINESDVEFINMSDDEDAINIFNKIYDNKEKKFNLSKFVYTRPYFFKTNSMNLYDMMYNLNHTIKENKNKLKYLLEKCGGKDKFLIEELKDEDLNNYQNYEINNKKSLIKPSKKKKPLLTFLIIFIVIGLLNFIISKRT